MKKLLFPQSTGKFETGKHGAITSFCSYRSVRSETIRFEPRSPRSLLNPLDRTSTDTYTATSTPQPNNDAIAQAVQILQSSCDMLDETVDRIQRRKLLGQNSNFSFPSENRQTTA